MTIFLAIHTCNTDLMIRVNDFKVTALELLQALECPFLFDFTDFRL